MRCCCVKVPSAHLNVLEHVGMVADLLQLHDGVHQGLGSSFALRPEMAKGRWLTSCTYSRAAAVAWRLEIHFLSPRPQRSGVAGRGRLGSGSPVRDRVERGGRQAHGVTSKRHPKAATRELNPRPYTAQSHCTAES